MPSSLEKRENSGVLNQQGLDSLYLCSQDRELDIALPLPACPFLGQLVRSLSSRNPSTGRQALLAGLGHKEEGRALEANMDCLQNAPGISQEIRPASP